MSAQAQYTIGVFSSASADVVCDVVHLLTGMQGPTGEQLGPLFTQELLFSARDTCSYDDAGRPHNVVKPLWPLQRQTGAVSRVLLVDDDVHKVSAGANTKIKKVQLCPPTR